MAYNPKDYYFKQAKKENYAARSVFKLQEIDQRFNLIKQGYKILDLGAAPGSWSQYASQKVGKLGRVLGIDLQPILLTLPNSVFVTADMRDLDLAALLKKFEFEPPFDLVLSDMAPKTTGIRVTDQTRSRELCDLALSVAEKYLRVNGHFVAKLFHSEEFEEFRDELKKRFKEVQVLRPKSTRKESKEVFLIGMRYQPLAKAVAMTSKIMTKTPNHD